MSQTSTFRHCYIQIFTSNPSRYLSYPTMDPLKIPSSSPSKLTQRSAPNCPRRRIHSSFPYYFYSTPSIPNSEGLSAFVSHCESRLSEDSELKVNNNNNNNGQTISFNCPPVTLATADDLFRDGKLIPSEPFTQPSPLKLPPRLQHIENIRKSLRGALSFNHRRSASEFTVSKGFDPFAVAMETVRKEDVPWCQISKQHRKAKSCEHMWLDMKPMWEIGNVNIALVGKDEGRGEEPGGGAWKKIKKRARILNYYFKSAAVKLVKYRENHHGATRLDPILEAANSGKSTRSNGEDHKLVCSDQRSSKKKSAGIRTLARHTQNHTKQILLAWLGCLRST